MRTLHIGIRVADLERSLASYTGAGDEVVGVQWPPGHPAGMTAADLQG